MVQSRWGSLLTEISDTVVERDEARQPPPEHLMTVTGSTGLQAFSLPLRVGGEEADALTWGMTLEHIGYLCKDSALPLIINHQVDIARLICESGREDLIDRYAQPLADGRCGAGIAYTENADAFSFRTEIRRKGDGYVLNGYKSYITGGQMSDYFLTYALDEFGDMQAFLVQTDDPGVTVTPAAPMGMRTAGASSVTFTDVELPRERILAATDGLTHAQRFLGNQRLWIACAPLGRAQAVLDECAIQLAGTTRYGEPVTDLKNVQASLGQMYIAIESARATLYHALSRVTEGHTEPLFDPVVSAAKVFAVNQIRFVLERALGILGGFAFYESPHLGRYMRDFAGLSLAAGTQDILEINLGAGVVARAGSNTDAVAVTHGRRPENLLSPTVA
ncbi:acyl-CoA dehydrogenase family protein [Rhodococcus qingshengii]|uniref:acyl-CoA dehydrogenase family protein n=1 Tax=Rhodococcus TaxID=1827 RepID=UPI001BB0C4DF|nr:acyl-CoA dehydrogenase [Rhodococcus qingshengii]MBS3695702.1 acyl-CoA dehydrogenase [Rhodococcus qingshengii]